MQRGSLMRSHGNIGSVSVLPILLVAVTGVILVYPTESRWLLLDSGREQTPVALQKINLDHRQADWATLLQEVEQRFHGSHVRWIQPASSDNPDRVIGLQQVNALNAMGKTSVRFSAQGELIIKDARQSPTSQRLFDFSYPLHVGKLGLWYRLLLSLFGLALAALCVFGLLSFTKRGRSPRQLIDS